MISLLVINSCAVGGLNLNYITRFFYSDIIKNHKEKASFLIRARGEIINESVKLLINCHNKHNDLEEIYKTAVNFDALNQYTDNLIEQIID